MPGFTHSCMIGTRHSSEHMRHTALAWAASSQLRPHCPCWATSSQLTAQFRVHRPLSSAHTGWWVNHGWMPCGAVNIHEKQQTWFPFSWGEANGEWLTTAPCRARPAPWTLPSQGPTQRQNMPTAARVTAPVRVNSTLHTRLAANCLAPPISLKPLKALLLKHLNFGK